MPHSCTSLIVGALIVVFVGIRSVNKNFIGTYMLAALVLLVVAELTFGISGRYVRESRQGLRPVGENTALDEPSWDCIPIRFLGRDLRASGWEKGHCSWKEFSSLSRTRLIMVIWKHI